MKRQCDSTSSGSEHPASKLANVGGSTPNWVIQDALGIRHIGGISTGLSENTVDVVSAGRLFGIASFDVNDRKVNQNNNEICVRAEEPVLVGDGQDTRL